MKKGLIIISSVLLGLFSSLFFSGCGGKDTDSDLSSRTVNEQDATNAVDKPRIDFTRMPLYFIANKGQVNEKAKYYAKASRYTLWLTGEGLVFDQASLPKKERIDGAGAESENPRRDVSSLVFVNANPDPAMMAVAETGHQVSYFIGNDPAKWHRNIPTSQAVLYQDLYQGIDLKVYGVEKQIEYDWIVKPGVDPEAIKFAYQGVKGTSIDAAGNLLIETTGGELIHNRPLTYQDIDGERVSVQAAYKQTGENTYGFFVGEYDKNHQLIIDPVVLLYSTCLGGRGDDHGYGIAADNNGNVYVTGTTWSLDFPTRSPYQTDPDIGGSEDVFVSKINTTAQWGANSLVYSTYLGGHSMDFGYGIAADASGNVYVTGETYSPDFPTRNPYQDQLLSYSYHEAFVIRIDTTKSGSASLVYSTYLGGGSLDVGKGIAADDSGNVYVTGSTYSTDFPTRNPYQTDQPADDVFVTKIDTNQSGDASLVYSTYLGGGNNDQGYGIAADISGNVYVTGWTGSTDFPTKNQYQTILDGVADAFVTKIDTNQSGDASLVYSTYLGGGNNDQGYGIAADISGNAYVTGYTSSTDFPTRNPYQTDKAYGDAFVTKIDANQSGDASLVFSTYLGGGGYDFGYGIAADDSGNVYLTGVTESSDFPTRYPYQTDRRFGDAFVTKIDTTRIGAVSLVYSTYLGGDNDDTTLGLYGDGGYGIAADDSGNVYVTGITGSTDFPTKNPFQGYLGGTSEAFVTKLSFSEPTPEPTPVQTEQWQLILDNGQGKANITLTEQDGTVIADGTWEYTYQGMKSSGPFTGAPVTISGKSIVITATGTATSPTAPPGYTTSPCTLVISGTAYDGLGSGTFTVTFQAYGWPDTISGNWGGTRTSGSGITAVKVKALPWLMLLLGD